MAAKKTKYIFISGGVLSSLGKGIASASLGLLLKQRGLSVTIMKFDPYINVDPGTMNPQQHGEVYVTDDGAECDLDLGHYERYLDVDGTRSNSVSSGQVYFEVIQRERQGQYLGKTVQVIPHITDEIKRRMTIYDKLFDIVIIEIGGTVGDIESLPFMESVRQLCMEKGPKSTLNIHLTYVPYIKSAGELKTKPTQHSVKMLMEMGIRPDILLCRTEQPINKELKSKIALFCNVEEDSVIEVLDAETIYEVPLSLAKRNLDQIVLKKFSMSLSKLDMDTWTKFVNRIKQPKHTVHIGLIGAPGFGSRGIEGKIEAIKYARENKIPFFGICLGMQCAVIEFARNVAGIKDAHSAEFKKGKDLVIHLMSAQKQVTDKGGTMRLGSYPCTIRKGTIAHAAYGVDSIQERHRHRYEFNNAYRKTLEDHGMKLSGVSPDTTLVEIIELKNHPWFVGVQFHPEYKSRAVKGHPLFISFVKAAMQTK